MADNELIDCRHLPINITSENLQSSLDDQLLSLDLAEQGYLQKVCAQSNMPADELAKQLGVSTRTFIENYNVMKSSTANKY